MDLACLVSRADGDRDAHVAEDPGVLHLVHAPHRRTSRSIHITASAVSGGCRTPSPCAFSISGVCGAGGEGAIGL